jgi:hypothetical protein
MGPPPAAAFASRITVWLLPGYCLVIAWLLFGYCVAIAGHRLVTAWSPVATISRKSGALHRSEFQ